MYLKEYLIFWLRNKQIFVLVTKVPFHNINRYAKMLFRNLHPSVVRWHINQVDDVLKFSNFE